MDASITRQTLGECSADVHRLTDLAAHATEQHHHPDRERNRLDDAKRNEQ